ncbi:MAG: hypothetical protein GX896_08350 [Clostridiales bacterium]|nr:hypothetical protein [Clostridiales bacterium]
MKILVLKTGGTIGSAYTKTEITKGNNIEDILYNDSFLGITFEPVNLMNVFSENIGFLQWNILINFIKKLDLTKYGGIIITHGSDTLSYTSALLGNLFSGIKTTLVLTASDKPLENPSTNGYINFSASVRLVQEQVKGVFTVWKNENENAKAYYGTDLCEADPFSDSFTSFRKMPFGKIIGNQLTINEKPVILNKSPQVIPTFKNQVLLIRCYPQIDFSGYRIENYSAIVVYLYHSCTAPTDSESSICEFLGLCKKLDIPVYLASFKDEDKYYETTNKMLKSGGIPLFNCSPENAYSQALIKVNSNLK